MKFFIFLIFALISVSVPAQAETLKDFLALQKDIPRFENYSAEKGLNRTAKTVDLDSYRDARHYRTVLRNGFKEPADFAGHYVIVSHGCGSGCQRNWVIDKETGKIVTDFYSQFGTVYRIDSTLLIEDYGVEFSLNSSSLADLPYGYQISYYVMEKGVLKLLKTIEPRSPSQEPQIP